MKAVLQRVSEARVVVDGQVVGAIAHGLLVLLCAEKGDTEVVGQKMLDKILKLRIFYDDAGKMNKSVTDVWTSVGVVLGIGLVHVTGWLWLDAAVAIGVAMNILKEGVHLVWSASQGLMDQAVEPEVMQQIQTVLHDFSHGTQHPEAESENMAHIVRFDHITTRKAGQRRFVDMHMHMPADWSLGRAAALRTALEQSLMREVPGLRATIQLLPSDVEAHVDDPHDVV